MKCPTDGSILVMSDRSGIEIDYCPQCRGVWLDRGELDKIIERSMTEPGPARPPAPAHTLPPRPAYGNAPVQDRGYRGYSAPSAPSPEDAWRHGHDRDGRRPRRRRESWLSELFD
ncbi:hypothetical protein EXU48_04145 [Occultella glacieicola]|uniref:Transcription factor zinc-finger domain-containing protein n=2 Tax=Occultella glacieicola TaxID=2518684 RepID=A0ABY2E763_9MICO|nr:zf-TFIIB domain-containing protein [Occultella glacieicola]TDE97393.1 hypothetical protein EXU48_04145 [Occultella glacieicola]